MSVVLHIAAYAGAKLAGFIGEPSSPPMMSVLDGAKKHSVPFSSTAHCFSQLEFLLAKFVKTKSFIYL
jgi:hypothetical protein